MKKQKHIMASVFISVIACILSSCAGQSSVDNGSSVIQSCRGFDFDKKFPGKDNRPNGVGYDQHRKRIYNKDGQYYSFYFGDERGQKRYFLEDLALSSKEKRYFAAYQKREEEFDRKYAGEIKRKLRALCTTSIMMNGKLAMSYPDYLEGDELPKGVATPASFFNPSFIGEYIEADKREGDMRDFVLSTELIKDVAIRDLAKGVGSGAAAQARWRLEALYTEYVLTWYFLKSYESPEERHQTAIALADYYSDVAFRGAAEALYNDKHFLTARQRCLIANYAASRVYDLVMVIDNPQRLAKIKAEYEQPLIMKCYMNLYYGRILEQQNKGLITAEEAKALDAELEIDVKLGETRCIND